MHSIIVNVKCIRSHGNLFQFPLTEGKIYKNSKVIFSEEIEKDGCVTLINDNGEIDLYSMEYFEVVKS